jgi:hypothetical protein
MKLFIYFKISLNFEFYNIFNKLILIFIKNIEKNNNSQIKFKL